MITIMCWVNSEDYLTLDSMMRNNITLKYYGYRFLVEGGSETSGGSGVVKVAVVELINANLSVGLILPEGITLDGEFQLRFISQDSPTEGIPVACKLSNEVKRTQYMGDDVEKLEYIGFSLEQFYQGKGATYYMLDLRGDAKPE